MPRKIGSSQCPLQYIDSSCTNISVSLVKFGEKGSVAKLLPGEETLVVATAEMKCHTSQPQPTRRLAAQLNSLLKSIDEVSPNKINHDIKPKSKLQYARRISKRVISHEPNPDSDKK